MKRTLVGAVVTALCTITPLVVKWLMERKKENDINRAIHDLDYPVANHIYDRTDVLSRDWPGSKLPNAQYQQRRCNYCGVSFIGPVTAYRCWSHIAVEVRGND